MSAAVIETSVVESQSFPMEADTADKKLKHKRRYCRTAGCSNIVKSQGLCQRHGAKPRMCKVDGCAKQAQGNFDGMCKSHFKAHKRSTTPLPPQPSPQVKAFPPPAEGHSVYDSIIPASISWSHTDPTPMPLIRHLKAGFDDPRKPPAWHRNEERRARGLWSVHNPATQLESWERELVWAEILLLTGNPESSFRHLARGWGRDKGFHMVLAQFICERHGNVERKKRKKMGEGCVAVVGADQSNVAGSDLYDDAIYGDAAYNEALAADLFAFEDSNKPNERMFSFEDTVVSYDGREEASSTEESEHRDDDEYAIPVIESTAAV